MKIFADNIIDLRDTRQMSQRELADAIGVTQQCISEWENGNVEPTLSNLRRIADYFDVSMDFLAGRTNY